MTKKRWEIDGGRERERCKCNEQCLYFREEQDSAHAAEMAKLLDQEERKLRERYKRSHHLITVQALCVLCV